MNYDSTCFFDSKMVPGVRFKLRKMSHGRRVKLNLAVAKMVAKGRDINQQLTPIYEEIQRAEDAAKTEPCSCNHPIAEDFPAIVELLAGVAKFNEAENVAKVQLGDICHNSSSKRCLVPGCSCRKPQPENNAYAERDRLIDEDNHIVADEINPEYIRWGVESIEGLEINGKPATVEALIEEAPEFIMAEVVNELQRLIKLSPEEQLAFNTPTTSGVPVAGPIPISSAPIADDKKSISLATATA